MKQVVEIVLKVTFDYDNPELLAMLKEEMVESGLTADQVRAKVKEEMFKEMKELIEDDLGQEHSSGVSYSVEVK